MRLEALTQQAFPFSARLMQVLTDLKMLEVCQELEMDHACVRLRSPSAVIQLATDLTQSGQLLSKANVGGRPIMIYELRQPLEIGCWETSCVELPFPKDLHSYEDGWEHVEFVLPNTANTEQGLVRSFEAHFPHLKHRTYVDRYQMKVSTPHATTDQLENPTVSIVSAGVGIKFHALPIRVVVAKR